MVPGFTRENGVKMLVWFEEHERIETVIQREHTMKHGSRRWKVVLIEPANPERRDLSPEINQPVARRDGSPGQARG